MNKIKLLFMVKKPTMLDFVGEKMTKNAKTVVMAAFEDAKKEQDKILKQAKSLSK